MSDSTRANIEITASSRKLARGLAAARRLVFGFASTAARGVSAAFKKIKLGDVGKNALGHFGGDMLSKGMDTIVDAAQGVRDFERDLIRFQITTGGSAASTARLRNQIRGVSRETGVAAAEVLAGASQYVALTGDAEGASTAMRTFARIAQASGASVSDVAQATAAMRTSMGLNANDIEAVFSSMIIQGKEGAVELKDLAGELATLAPQFAQFRGGKSVGGIRELGAALQVVRSGAGTASEAATQLESLMGELAKPEVIRKLAKLKINIFDKDPRTGLTTLRNASDIFEDLAKNQKLSDPRIVAAIFGRKEAQQAIRSIREHIDLYRDLKVAAEDTGAVQRDLNTFLESDAGRLDKAMNDLKVTIAEAFTPERIQAFVSAVEDLAGKIGPLVEGLGKINDYTFGGLFNVGKSVRGYLSGNENGNPFRRKGFGALGDTIGQYFGDQTKEGKERAANAAGYDRAVNDILGGEVNERTSPESIKRAVFARYSANSGAATAGNRYLANVFGSGDEVAAAVDRVVRQAAVEMGKQAAQDAKRYADAVVSALSGLSFNLGRDQVVDAVDNSSKNRTSPRP